MPDRKQAQKQEFCEESRQELPLPFVWRQVFSGNFRPVHFCLAAFMESSSSATALDQAYALALQLFQSGALSEAEQGCRVILQADPARPDVILLLGICCWQRGDAGQALQAYDLALALRPNFGEALFNRGLALRALGRLHEALGSYRRAGECNPDWADIPFNMGNLLLELGAPAEALKCFDRAIDLNPGFVQAHCNRGNCLSTLEKFEEAAASYERAVEAAPDYADAYFNLGELNQTQRRFQEALHAYDAALRINPKYTQALNNRALVLLALGRGVDALASVDQALVLMPDNARAHNNRGVVLADMERFAEAEACYIRALQLSPEYPDAWYNRGQACQTQLRLADALENYDQALRLRPDYVDCLWNQALCRLLEGDLQRGWHGYETRWRIAGEAAAVPPQLDGPPCLQPGDAVAGRTVLIWAEQGFGDTLQFVRYSKLLIEGGAQVVLQVQPALVPLLKEQGLGQVIAQGDARPAFDFHCPMLSLPRVFGVSLGNIPSCIPYVREPEARRTVWRDRKQGMPGARIGLVWSGSPTHKGDRQRSLPFSVLGPLWELGNVSWISLQPVIREIDQQAVTDSPVHCFDNALQDFADTAALVAEMDLIITADTAVAHLAGAMGKPVWILLPHFPDWRWLLERTDSPWYPTARLFRQPRPGDWGAVIAEVTTALAAQAW